MLSSPRSAGLFRRLGISVGEPQSSHQAVWTRPKWLLQASHPIPTQKSQRFLAIYLLFFALGATGLELSNTILFLQKFGTASLLWIYGGVGLVGLLYLGILHLHHRQFFASFFPQALQFQQPSPSSSRIWRNLSPLVGVALLCVIQSLGTQTGTILGIRFAALQIILIQLWCWVRHHFVTRSSFNLIALLILGLITPLGLRWISARSMEVELALQHSLLGFTGLMILATGLIVVQPLSPVQSDDPSTLRSTQNSENLGLTGLLQRRFDRFQKLWTGLWITVQLALLLLEIWVFQQLAIQLFGVTVSALQHTWLPLVGLIVLKGSTVLWLQQGVPAATSRFIQVLPSSFQAQLYQRQSLAHAIALLMGSGLLLGFSQSDSLSFIMIVGSPVWSLGLGAIALLGGSILVFLRRAYFHLLIHSVAAGFIQTPIASGPLIVQAIVQAFKASLRPPIQLIQAQQCLELLGQASPEQAEKLLIPLLPSLPTALQLSSLKLLEKNPSVSHEIALRHLLTPVSSPEVYGAALRYLLRIAPPETPEHLRQHLKIEVPVPVRSVAAAFMLACEDGSAQRSGSLAFVHMLTHKSEVERLMGAEALRDSQNLVQLKAYIPALLRDFVPEVRGAVLMAIAHTRTAELYPDLLRALHKPLTQTAAQAALISMGDDAVPLLKTHQTELSDPLSGQLTGQLTGQSSVLDQQLHNWQTLNALDSPQALETLASELPRSSGMSRYHLLKLLLQRPRSIQAVHQQLSGETGIKALLNEELWLLGHLYGALVDLAPKGPRPSEEERRFREALIEQQRNVGERVLLLLRLLYPRKAIAQAAQHLRNPQKIPQGIAQLERLLSPDLKAKVLAIFAAQSARRKLHQLKREITYEPLPSHQRLRSLLALHPGLEDWPRACGFYLASQKQWRIPDEALLDALNHPNPTVQEAANHYLSELPSETPDLLSSRGSEALPTKPNHAVIGSAAKGLAKK